MDFMKKCAKCGELKTLEQFNRDNSRKDGKYPNCNLCEKIRNAARYIANREKLLAENKKWREENKDKRKAYLRTYRHKVVPTRKEPLCCEICGSLPTSKGLHLDHCHEKKIFRGWLCMNCNLALGNVRDSAYILRRLADYVEKFVSVHASLIA